MRANRTISNVLDVPDLATITRDEALVIVKAYIETHIPECHEFEVKFLDFGIQESLTSTPQIMFSADVEIWSKDD